MTGALSDKEINQTYVKVTPHMMFLSYVFENKFVTVSPSFALGSESDAIFP